MARARLRPPGRLRRPRAQRQPGVPDRLRSALRGGDPRRRAGRRPGRSSSATSATAWPAPRRCRCAATCSRTSACRASRATARGRWPTILGDEGIGDGRRVGVVGWKTYAEPVDARGARRSSSTSCAAWSGRADSSRTPTTCSSTPADGLRVINEVEQLAAMEAAACTTSSGVHVAAHRPPARACASATPSRCSAGTARRCPAT